MSRFGVTGSSVTLGLLGGSYSAIDFCPASARSIAVAADRPG